MLELLLLYERECDALLLLCAGLNVGQVKRKARRVRQEMGPRRRKQAALQKQRKPRAPAPARGHNPPGAPAQDAVDTQQRQAQQSVCEAEQSRGQQDQGQVQQQQSEQGLGAGPSLPMRQAQGPRLAQGDSSHAELLPVALPTANKSLVPSRQLQQQQQRQALPAHAWSNSAQDQFPGTPNRTRLATSAVAAKAATRREDETPLRQKIQELLSIVPGHKVCLMSVRRIRRNSSLQNGPRSGCITYCLLRKC